MSKLITVTRKIQLLFNTPNEHEVKEFYKTLNRWQRIVRAAANKVATHLYIQEHIKQFHYLEEGIKVKLANMEKDDLGILTTSKMNSTYQVLSKKFKGEIPTAILTALNSVITKTYNKESSEYYKGERSLRTYRKTIPIPFPSASITNMHKVVNRYNGREYHNYAFTLFGVPFKTLFRRDLSRNGEMWARSIAGEYKLADSSIKMEEGKIYLLAVFQFEKENHFVNPDKVAECTLDINTPIIVTIPGEKGVYQIGSKNEFLTKRIALQAAVKRFQKESTYIGDQSNRRKEKLRALDRVSKAEGSFVEYHSHLYSRKLVDYALKNHCGVILLKNQTQKEAAAKEDQKFLLRNWSYFNLKEKIMYKAAKVGIEVKVE